MNAKPRVSLRVAAGLLAGYLLATDAARAQHDAADEPSGLKGLSPSKAERATSRPDEQPFDLGESGADEPAFLEFGAWTGTIVGSSTIVGEEPDLTLGFQATRFVLDRLELGAEATTHYAFQEGDDAVGVSLSGIVRYHVIARDRWTGFVDGGFGFLVTTESTPPGGTGVNFLPRFGAGATYRLDDRLRLIGGLRWHHISNARVLGDDNNPSEDEIAFYVGVQFDL